MILNSFLSKDRLYVSTMSEEEIKKCVFSESGEEYVGAGVKAYGIFVGFILSKLDISSKIKVGDKSFYINNKSFSKLVIRNSETEPGEDSVKELNDRYILSKDFGYDKNKLKALNATLKSILNMQHKYFYETDWESIWHPLTTRAIEIDMAMAADWANIIKDLEEMEDDSF